MQMICRNRKCLNGLHTPRKDKLVATCNVKIIPGKTAISNVLDVLLLQHSASVASVAFVEHIGGLYEGSFQRP